MRRYRNVTMPLYQHQYVAIEKFTVYFSFKYRIHNKDCISNISIHVGSYNDVLLQLMEVALLLSIHPEVEKLIPSIGMPMKKIKRIR